MDNRLVVPKGAKVRVLLTASDVIHAWWVPAFGMKKDAIPGFVNELWFRADETGVFRGQCAELCGRDHGFMPIVVEVMERARVRGLARERQTTRLCNGDDRERDFTRPGAQPRRANRRRRRAIRFLE